jgi:RIB43A
MAERKKLAEVEREIDQKHLKALQDNDQKAIKFENSERLRRQRLHAGNVEYNLAMVKLTRSFLGLENVLIPYFQAAEQRANRHRRKLEEQNDNRAEITNHLTSDMLTENPEVANSALGPHRKIAYQYKGMSDEEIAAVRAQQQQQQDEMRRQRSGEQMTHEKWDKLEQQQARSVHLKERELDRQMRNLTLNMLKDNAQLAAEQKQQADYKDNVLYTNVPTTEYFAQFNTGTR